MIKKNLKTLILTSVIILLPILAGLILWDKLPEKVPVHFNAQGVADGYGSRGMAVFMMPLFMLAVHWLCTVITSLDPKSKNITPKSMNLVLWIIPAISILVSGVIYVYALGKEFNVGTVIILFFGFFFVVIGNYLPKCKQNYTIGIKIPWTLDSTENWNFTHRLAGKTWLIGGLLLIATAFFNLLWLYFAIFVIMVAVPVAGSYLFYKKENKNDLRQN